MTSVKPTKQELPPFDEWLAQLQQPAVATPRRTAAARGVVQGFIDGEFCGHDRIDLAFDCVAAANDVDGLQRMVASSEGRRLLNTASSIAVTYCVAHMLVDNSGNEAFARDWLQARGVSTNWARIQAGILAGDDRDMISTQRLLAVSQMVSIFETGPSNGAAPLWSFAKYSEDAQRQQEQCYALAAILRLNHPDQMPDAEVKNSYGAPTKSGLLRAMWGSDPLLSHLLPAIELAYDARSPEIQREMEIGILSTINNGRLAVNRTDRGLDPQWDAIAKWGSDNVGPPILHCKTSNGSLFCEELMKLPFELGLKRFNLILEKGAQLDSPILGTSISNYNAAHRLLDVAVNAGVEQMTGHLLGLDADPTLPSEMNAGPNSQTAVEIAENKFEASGSDPSRERILTMVKAAAARKEALKVLAELSSMEPLKP